VVDSETLFKANLALTTDSTSNANASEQSYQLRFVTSNVTEEIIVSASSSSDASGASLSFIYLFVLGFISLNRMFFNERFRIQNFYVLN
jgi:hypothetical protein